MERALEAGGDEPPECGLDFFQVVLQGPGIAVGLDFELEPIRLTPLDLDLEGHLLAPEHLGVAGLDPVDHSGGRRNVGERREDPRQRRGDSIREEPECQAEGQDAVRTKEQRPAQASPVDDLARPEPADPLQGLLNQPAIELRRLGRLVPGPGLLQIDAAHQPVMDAGQVSLDPPRHADGTEPAEDGPDHAGDERPACRHDHQNQGEQPQHRLERQGKIEQRKKGQHAQSKPERQAHARGNPARPQEPGRAANQAADRPYVGGRDGRFAHGSVLAVVVVDKNRQFRANPRQESAPVIRPTQAPGVRSRSFWPSVRGGPSVAAWWLMVASRNSAAIKAKTSRIKGRQTSRSSPSDPYVCSAPDEAEMKLSWAVGSHSRIWSSATV